MSDDAVELLWAEREIRRQLNTYCRGLDRFDPELWRSVWHTDGTLDYRRSNLRGVASDLSELMTLGHVAWASHSHQITSASITVRGDRAVSETFNNNILRGHVDEAGIVVDNHYRGRYFDFWSKRGGRWAIDHRSCPGGISWQQTISESRLGTLSRRSRDDPSYALFASLEDAADGREALEVLVAEREIRRQLANYCHAVDRFDLELWKSVWHPDALLEYVDAGLRGTPAELVEIMTRGHDAWASHAHHLTNSLIEISGDSAVSETGATAILHGYPDASGEVVSDHYRGRYLDRWSKRDGRWAIEHRLMVEDFMWRQPAAGGCLGERARRDTADPSYDLLASLV